MDLDRKLFEEAKKHLPGGVNSPVRSFKAVGGAPVVVKKGMGARIFGENGKSYIDYCQSWGALILGHAHPAVVGAVARAAKNGTSFGALTRAEIKFAEMISAAIPSMELIRLTNSGTEATTAAVRLAAAYSGKKKVIYIDGGYHGAGIPQELAVEAVAVPYNDLKAIEDRSQGAGAIIVEAAAGNMGLVPPRPDYLAGIREICDRRKIVFILDEVITGFRLGFCGAQKIFKVKPDLTTLGKIIGGGLPVGAFGGKAEIMRLISPSGPLVQAGTFSGNPVTVAAGTAALNILKKTNPYPQLEKKTRELCARARASAVKYGVNLTVNQLGSMFTFFFSDQPVTDFQGASRQDREKFKRFFHGLLAHGIYLAPSGFETNFLSAAHRSADVEKTARSIDIIMKRGLGANADSD